MEAPQRAADGGTVHGHGHGHGHGGGVARARRRRANPATALKLQGAGDIRTSPAAGRRLIFIARELILFREGKCTNSGDTPMV